MRATARAISSGFLRRRGRRQSRIGRSSATGAAPRSAEIGMRTVSVLGCAAGKRVLAAGDRAAPARAREVVGKMELGVAPQLADGRSERGERVRETRRDDDRGVVEGGARGSSREGDDVLAQGAVGGEREIAAVREERCVRGARAEHVADDAELDGVVIAVRKGNGRSDLLMSPVGDISSSSSTS